MSAPSTPTVPGPPQAESAIYVENIHHGDDHYYDLSDNTAIEVRPLGPRQVWIDMDQVPFVPPGPPAPFPGTTVGVVSAISGVPLSQMPNNPYRFIYIGPPPQRLADVIPANYGGGAYAPTLRDSTGAIIPYNPAVWVVDGVLRVVEFKAKTPSQLGYFPPLMIDYWRYVGNFAGAGGVGPVPVPPPLAIQLYVDDTGNNITGDGTFANPYGTIQYAFEKIAETGWISTAEVIIKNTSTISTTTTAPLALNTGSLGQQITPPIIRGVPQTVLSSAAVVSVSRDPGSNLLQVTAAPGTFAAGDVGRIVRFTSGPLSTYAPADFAPAAGGFQLAVYISAFISTSQVRLAYADALSPAVGNTFDILTNVSRLITTGAPPLVVTSSGLLVWQNLDMQLSGGLTMLCPSHLVGVRFPLRANVVVSNPGSAMQWGTFPVAYVQSALGVASYTDNLLPPGSYLFERQADDDTELVVTNSAFQSATQAARLEGSVRVTAAEFTQGGQVDARYSSSAVRFLKMSGGAATVVCRDGAGLDAQDLSLGPTTAGAVITTAAGALIARNGGVIALRGSLIMTDAAAGLRADASGVLTMECTTCTYNVNAGLTAFAAATRGGTVNLMTAFTINRTSTLTYGFFADAAGFISINTATTLDQSDVRIQGNSRLVTASTLTVSAAGASEAIGVVGGSTLAAAGLTASAALAKFVRLDNSTLNVGALSCNNCTTGVEAVGISQINATSFSATNCPTAAMTLTNSYLDVAGAFTATGSDCTFTNSSVRISGAVAARDATVTTGSDAVMGAVTVSTIVIDENSSAVTNNITTSGSTGVRVRNGSTLVADDLTCTGVGTGTGLSIFDSTVFADDVTVSNKASGIGMAQSTCYIDRLTITNCGEGINLTLNSLMQIYLAMSITNSVSRGISMNASSFYYAAELAIPPPTIDIASTGIQATAGSLLAFNTAPTITACTIGISLRFSSTLRATSVTTIINGAGATVTAQNGLILGEGSTATFSDLSISNHTSLTTSIAGGGIECVDSAIHVNDLSVRQSARTAINCNDSIIVANTTLFDNCGITVPLPLPNQRRCAVIALRSSLNLGSIDMTNTSISYKGGGLHLTDSKLVGIDIEASNLGIPASGATDGFIATLSGSEIILDNTPTGTITATSIAPRDGDDYAILLDNNSSLSCYAITATTVRNYSMKLASASTVKAGLTIQLTNSWSGAVLNDVSISRSELRCGGLTMTNATAATAIKGVSLSESTFACNTFTANAFAGTVLAPTNSRATISTSLTYFTPSATTDPLVLSLGSDVDIGNILITDTGAVQSVLSFDRGLGRVADLQAPALQVTNAYTLKDCSMRIKQSQNLSLAGKLINATGAVVEMDLSLLNTRTLSTTSANLIQLVDSELRTFKDATAPGSVATTYSSQGTTFDLSASRLYSAAGTTPTLVSTTVGLKASNSSSVVIAGPLDVNVSVVSGNTGIQINTLSTLVTSGLLSRTGPIGNLALHGLLIETQGRAAIKAANSNTLNGTLGAVLLGANAAATWANIASGATAFVSDFANATPQLCTCTPTP